MGDVNITEIFKKYSKAIDELDMDELNEINDLIDKNDDLIKKKIASKHYTIDELKEINDLIDKNDDLIKNFALKHYTKFDYVQKIDQEDTEEFAEILSEIERGEPLQVTIQRFILVPAIASVANNNHIPPVQVTNLPVQVTNPIPPLGPPHGNNIVQVNGSPNAPPPPPAKGLPAKGLLSWFFRDPDDDDGDDLDWY